MKNLKHISVIVLFLIFAATAVCGGGGGSSIIHPEPDATCGTDGINNSCTPSGLAALISAANDGDVIGIATGVHTWNSPVTVNKPVMITGWGSCPDCGSEDPSRTWSWPTRIINNGNAAFIVNAADAADFIRISGLYIDGDPPAHSYNSGANTANIVLHTDNRSLYRLANLRFNHSGNEEQSAIRTNALAGFGVSDHIFYSASGQAFNSRFIHNTGYGGDDGDSDWAVETQWGSDQFHYVEDSTFLYPTYSSPNIPAGINDQQGGGRGVFRYCYIANANAGNHGTESGWPQRSGVAQEFYNNTFYGGDPGDRIFAALLLRGGSVYFHNNTIRNFQEMARLAVYRVSDGNGCGICGSPACVDIDGPGPPQGYPCLDQVGRGQANGVGIENTQPQASNKAHFWNNTLVNTDVAITVQDPSYITDGTDYEYSSGDSKKPSGYTPYTYPHPLTKIY